MVATTICGTDLHIFKGDVPEVELGRILGHEGIGVITEIGAGVTQLAVGDKVILSCVSSCGRCSNCRQGLFSHCLDPEGIAGIGWIFGYMIDGTQAEFVRVPFAENSVYKIPAADRRRGHLPVGHPADRLRNWRAVRRRAARRRRRGHWLRSGRPLGRHDLAPLRTVKGHRHRPRQRPSEAGLEFGATDTVNSGDATGKSRSWPSPTERVSTSRSRPWAPPPSPWRPKSFALAARGQHWRARQAGGVGAERTVDQEHRHLDGTREHQHARHAAQARHAEEVAGRELRDARILVRSNYRRPTTSSGTQRNTTH